MWWRALQFPTCFVCFAAIVLIRLLRLGYEEAVGPPPGLTVRSPSLIAVEHRYDRPHNFDDRNRLLFKTLDHRLSAVQLDKFKAVSGAFRKGERDADEYLAEISALLGERLAETLPELICLLPDIQRQRDLLQAYEKFADHHAGARPKKSWNPASTDFTVKAVRAFRFRLCPTCGQVLTDADFNPHLGTHHLQDEFPTLES
uniref:C2H2-type domain-containing protein n=1 Tax=Plectus sambesii TaxID=2011161 RepID=A0A914X9X5_9BILA